MRLSLTKSKDRVLVTPESSKEWKILDSFPGLLKNRDIYYFPARINLCKNIISRLKKKVDSVSGSAEVISLYKSDFRLKEIPSSFKYFTTPLEHQEIALRYLYTNGGGGLLLDPGLGKTKVVLDFIKLMNFKRSLIICPKALLFVWEDEVAVHRPDLKIHIRRSMTWDVKIPRLEKKIAEKEEWLKNPEGIDNPKIAELIALDRKKLSRQKSLLKRMKKDYEEDIRKESQADIVVINYEKCIQGEIELSDAGFDFMAIDEGLVKDPKTTRTKSITRLAKRIPSKVIMSGTLVNNTPEDIFAPVRIMEPCLVGGSFHKFQAEYCIQRQVQEDGVVKGKFTVGYRNLEEIKGILQCISVVMRKEEWLKDLPDKEFEDIICEPTEEQRALSDELASNFITKVGDDYLEVDSPLTVMGKLYQISNGFVYLDEEQEDINALFGQESTRKSKKNRKTVYLDNNPKIEAFRNLYKDRLSKRKFIVWYNMDAEFYILAKLLKELGIPYESIRGGEKHTGDKVRDFNADPNVQALVCQAKSVNYGITVLGTHPDKLEKDIEAIPDINPQVFTEVFFSLNFSLEVFLQQQDRIHRIGQTNKAQYFILLNDTPVERKISKALSDKLVLRNDILEDILAQIRDGLLV